MKHDDMKDFYIRLIREYQYYEDGALESMTLEELREIYERLLDWIG